MKISTNSKITSGLHTSYWINTVSPRSYETLQRNLQTDVVIVGGGIAGLSVAYVLSSFGRNVVVLEDGYIGSGETGRTSAHLTAALDNRYYQIAKLFGEDGARLAAQSHSAAIDFIERTAEKESIDCEFLRVPGYLFRNPSDKESSIDKEYHAAMNAGLDVVMHDSVPGIDKVFERCIEFRNQAQFHPMKYIHGLCDAIIKMGGKIYTQTHVSEVNSEGVVSENGFKVGANHIVIATNSPVNNKYVMHLKQFAFRTYVVGALIKKNSFPKALWWDTGDSGMDPSIPPYHYIRTEQFDNENDLLLCGGEDHATGLADAGKILEEDRYLKIEEWMRDKFDIGKIVYRWSGQVMEPVDAMGYIGHNPMDKENVYIVTGDSGNGLTHGTIAGILITDLINGKDNPWKRIYSPGRFRLKSAMIWMKEFGEGFMDYLKFNPDHADEVLLSSIEKGHGKIVQLDKEKYGVYRDEDDQLHFVSAECTHLKCIVKWNNDEKSWDCPCHGSRFTYEGEVINGPANINLFYCKSELKMPH